jgi:hypothetical protein
MLTMHGQTQIKYFDMLQYKMKLILVQDICESNAFQVWYTGFFMNKCGSHEGELSILMYVWKQSLKQQTAFTCT